MKNTNFKFYPIKAAVFLLINLFCFAVAFLLSLIFESLGNPHISALIASGVSGICFLAYIFKTSQTLKNPDSFGASVFALRETAAYSIMMLLPLLCAFIVGTEAIHQNYIMKFFLPNTFFFYLTGIPAVGFAIHILLFFTAVFAARHIHK